jgi:hypothetical protein
MTRIRTRRLELTQAGPKLLMERMVMEPVGIVMLETFNENRALGVSAYHPVLGFAYGCPLAFHPWFSTSEGCIAAVT